MYVMHLSTMTMLLLLAQMSNRDGGTGMKTTELDKGYLMLHRGVQHMRASGSFGRFTLFHHLSHHPMTLAVGRLCWCFVFGLRFFWVCVCFLFWDFTIPPRVLDLDDRQGFTARSAMR